MTTDVLSDRPVRTSSSEGRPWVECESGPRLAPGDMPKEVPWRD